MSKLLPIQYAKVLYALTRDVKKTELDGIMDVFIKRVSDDQMLSKIDYIISAFETYAKEQEGIVSLDVTTAHDVGDSIMKKITTAFGKDVEVSTAVDDSLIGGVVVRHGNTILDASLQTQLTKLKRTLT